MGKDNYLKITSAVLIVAVVVLYVLFFTSGKSIKKGNSQGVVSNASGDSLITLPIAYVNVDSLLISYNYAKDLNEILLRKQESTQATLNQKQRELNMAAQEFDRKLRNNAFLSPERAQQEQERILKMNQDYQQLADRLTQELLVEQQKLNIQMEDTISVRIAEFNKDKKYDFIFSNRTTSTILYAHEKYDITKEVTDYLNKQYGPTTEASSDK